MELRNWKARVEAWFIRLRAWWMIRMELRSWRARVEAAREKYDRLDHLSSIISPIAPNIWEEVQETIETRTVAAQSLKLPVLFFLLDRRDMKNLQSLNQFLGDLRKSSNRKHREECGQLAYRLRGRIDDYRRAAGALFETDILIRLLEKNPEGSVCLYPQIQNGHYPDASFRLGNKTVYLEATIRSQTKKQERTLESGHASSPVVVCTNDPYDDARLFIEKIKEKREQLADKSPNILCIGLPDSAPSSSSVKWGINAIFSGDLKPAQSIIRRQKGRLSNDKNLADAEVQQIEKNIERLERREEEFQAEPRLTGVLVFRWELSDFRPERHFWNPSPCLESQLSPTEQKTILDWFGFPHEDDAGENEKPEIFKRDRVEAAKRKRIEELARSEIVKNDRSNMTAEETARVVQEAYGRARDMADKEFSDNE